MKCQILFSGKNKKNNIILSSAENAQRVVKVNQLVLYRNNPLKDGRKRIHHESVHAELRSHPPGRNFNQVLGKAHPWLKFRPLGSDFLILHGHS